MTVEAVRREHDPRDAVSRTENPYWDAVKTIPGDNITMRYDARWEPDPHYIDRLTGECQYPNRFEMTFTYSWCIPDPVALEFVAGHCVNGRCVEIGAGTGYWAWQLTQLGIDVVAIEAFPPHKAENHYHCPTRDGKRGPDAIKLPGPEYYPLTEGNHEALREHGDRTLFMCWPPYSDPTGEYALQCYPGDKVIYIGESEEGCTGDRGMWRELFCGWQEVATLECVQWSGLHDWITVYERRAERLPREVFDARYESWDN